MSLPTPLVHLRRRLGLFPTAVAPAPEGTLGDGDGGLLTENSELLERGAWTLVWLGVLVGGVVLWASWWSWPVITVLAPALVALSIVGMVMCWCASSPRWWLHQSLAMAGALSAVAAPALITLHTRIFYLTDSAALDHVATRALVQGHNPYTSALSSTRLLLDVPQSFWTYTLTGGHVSTVSYPAGSFLFYAPAFALGFRHEVVDWMDLYAWLAAALLLFFLLPRAWRWIAALVTLTGVFTAIFSGGGTDAAVIPFAMLALWRWDRFGRAKEAGLARWIGPVALGVACSIKQTPWFLIPFLVVGVAIETRRAGRSPFPVMARYVAIAAGGFLAVNLPFIIWSPGPWWHGTVLPITQPLVADGQGVVTLALHGLTGGVNLDQLMVASSLALLSVLAAFVVWYDNLKRIWLLLLPASFFFAPRSFTGYLLDLFPVAIVGLVTVERARRANRYWTWGRFRVGRLVFGALAVATGALTAVSFTEAPLQVNFDSAAIGPEQQHLLAVVVTVTNTTAETVRPHFMVDLGLPHPTGFWVTPSGRSVVLGPHARTTVVLSPPTPTYLPPWASDYVIYAYLDNPKSLSTTTEIWHNYIPKHLTPAQSNATGTRR